MAKNARGVYLLLEQSVIECDQHANATFNQDALPSSVHGGVYPCNIFEVNQAPEREVLAIDDKSQQGFRDVEGEGVEVVFVFAVVAASLRLAGVVEEVGGQKGNEDICGYPEGSRAPEGASQKQEHVWDFDSIIRSMQPRARGNCEGVARREKLWSQLEHLVRNQNSMNCRNCRQSFTCSLCSLRDSRFFVKLGGF